MDFLSATGDPGGGVIAGMELPRTTRRSPSIVVSANHSGDSGTHTLPESMT